MKKILGLYNQMPRRYRLECRYFLTERGCRRGNECLYAHVYHNQCNEYARDNSCPREPYCQFPHVEPHDVLCRYFARGYCKYGAHCRFAHVIPVHRQRRQPADETALASQPEPTTNLLNIAFDCCTYYDRSDDVDVEVLEAL